MSGRPPLQIPLGSVNFGDLKRLSPIGRDWGYDRGTPVDRHYIEGFLARNVGDIRGHVLEFATSEYTKRFGRAQVERSDVLTVETTSRNATIVGDLAQANTLPAATFDCIICTQVLQYIYDLRAGAAMLHRALKPGGILLMTVPSLAPMADHPGRPDLTDSFPWHWGFTPLALRRLLEDAFGQDRVTVETHGNVLAATAFLYGLAVEELDIADLSFNDRTYPVTVAARAVKRTAT
jgi:SAM-dependent methyltransferase